MKWFQRTFFTRMLLSFTLVLVAVVVSLSAVIYTNVEEVVSKTVEQSNLSTLSQISYSASYMDESAKNLAFSIYNDPSTARYMYQGEIDPMDLNQEVVQLRTWAVANPFVYSIYIYNQKMNTYISNIGSSSGEPAVQFFDKGMLEIMSKIGKEPKSLRPIPRTIKFDSSGIGQFSQVSVFTYTVYDLLSTSNDVEGAVIINIKAEYLASIINSLMAKNNAALGTIFIVDAKGNAVTAFDGFAVNENMSGQRYVQKVLQAGGKSGNFRETINGKNMLVTYVTSDVLGWDFIDVVPYNTIYEPLNKIKRISILVCIVILASGLFAAFLVSRKIYWPIRELVGKITNLSKPQEDHSPRIRDELAYLSNTFSETFQKARLLDTEFRQRNKNETLSNLLLSPGQLSMEAIYPVFLRHQVAVDPDRDYVMILFKMDLFATFTQKYSPKDQTLFRYALANIVQELLAPYYPFELIDMGSDQLVGLLNPGEKTEAAFRSELIEIIRNSQQGSKEYLRLSFSVSMGSYKDNILEMNKGYQELSDLIKYRFVYGHECLLTMDILDRRHTEDYKFPSQLEGNLLEELASGNLEAVKLIYHEIIEQVQPFYYNTIMSALLYMIYFINNKVTLLESHSRVKFHIDFQSFTKDISTSETLEEVNERFDVLFKQITDLVNYKASNRGQLVIESVISRIEENYADPALCLESIAQVIKLSKVYLGKLFRDEIGQSVADYITEVRIRQVIKLLHNKNATLTDIMDQVGIENKSYFYKQFKTKTGVSFSDYKLRHLDEGKGSTES